MVAVRITLAPLAAEVMLPPPDASAAVSVSVAAVVVTAKDVALAVLLEV